MTDIVERLRSKSPYLHGSSAERTMAEAAAEIERLTALHEAAAARAEMAQIDNERLRASIAYVRMRSARACEILNEFDNTRAALEPKP